MNRIEVIQSIIKQKRSVTYLEIGVNNGFNFFKIKAPKKIAVDPKFCYSARRKLSWYLKNWTNWRARYFEVTSDDYFAGPGASVTNDVVFIDGLHTYEQSLRDVMNALDHLKEGGVIVMHDCNPPDALAATRAESLETSGTNRAWCGDVYKTICHLRSQRSDLNVFVLDCDYGLGIVTRGKPESMLSLSTDEIAKMTYDDLARDKKGLLNLKEEKYFFEFLSRQSSA